MFQNITKAPGASEACNHILSSGCCHERMLRIRWAACKAVLWRKLNVGKGISMRPLLIAGWYRVSRKGAELFWEFFFFFRIFFWLEVVLGLSRLLFGKAQGWNAGFVRFFRTFGGGFRAVRAPFWGNQWWNAGFVRVGHDVALYLHSMYSNSFLVFAIYLLNV